MSEREPGREPEPVDETDESVKLYVADPDDYAKTRKLRAINDAKAHYRGFTTERNERHKNLTNQVRFPADELERQEAEALALYASELLPLIDEAIQKGSLSEDDLVVERDRVVNNATEGREMSIREVARTQAYIPTNGEPQPLHKSFQMKVFRELEKIEREIGLGIGLEPEQDDEWEIET